MSKPTYVKPRVTKLSYRVARFMVRLAYERKLACLENMQEFGTAEMPRW